MVSHPGRTQEGHAESGLCVILTQAEIVELTGKQKRPAQARVLNHLGIPYKTRLGAELKDALAEYAKIIEAPKSGMAALINQAMRPAKDLKSRISAGVASEYWTAISRLFEPSRTSSTRPAQAFR